MASAILLHPSGDRNKVRTTGRIAKTLLEVGVERRVVMTATISLVPTSSS